MAARAQPAAKPGEIRLASFDERRDWQAFLDAYLDPTAGVGLPNRAAIAPVCRGPITYQGQEDVQRDIADMKAASVLPEPVGAAIRTLRAALISGHASA